MSVLWSIGIILAIIGSIAAWVNTNTILTELATIKKELGIQDKKKVVEILSDDEIEKELEAEHSQK